jgi:hypothetical protein
MTPAFLNTLSPQRLAAVAEVATRMHATEPSFYKGLRHAAWLKAQELTFPQLTSIVWALVQVRSVHWQLVGLIDCIRVWLMNQCPYPGSIWHQEH